LCFFVFLGNISKKLKTAQMRKNKEKLLFLLVYNHKKDFTGQEILIVQNSLFY